MEGLIPLLYKAIKDRRSSSSGGGVRAGAYPGSEHGDDDDDRFDAAPAAVDLGDPEQRRRWLELEVRSPLRAASSASASDGRRAQVGHGRNRSLEELAAEVGNSPGRRLRVALPKARSVRVFSCIGAGAAA